MKTQRMIIALTFVMIMFMATGTVSADLNAGLVAHYPFNGNANDESGNGNHGTVNGATLTNDRFGNADSAYSFDGTDDYINIGDVTTVEGLTETTFSFWFKKTGNGDTENKPLSKDNSYEINVRAGGSNAYAFGIDNIFVTFTPTPTDNVWTHVVFIYRNGITDGTELFENGVLIDTDTLSRGTISDQTTNLTLGGRETGHSFNGLMDDVRIYNRALTASEIQELYQGTVPPGEGSGDGHSLDAADGDPTDAVFVDNEGNVGIGTTNPGIYKLAVNGTIKSREVVVETTGWSDFVFEEHYALMPLDQLEKYIKSNKRLPQIPSAEDVAVKGIKVGSMQSKLLQKIEELTLYMIKLKKKTEMFEEDNQVLRSENDLIKKRLKALEKGRM